MRKLIDALVVTGALGFATVVVLALVFIAAGVIDKPKLVAVGDILAGRRPAVTPEPSPSATPLPLTVVQRAESAKIIADAVAAQEAEYLRKLEELDRLERQLTTLASGLDKRRKDIDVREKKVAKAMADFLEAQAAQAEAREKEGFKDSLKVFEAMRPDDAGRLLITFEDEDIIEYLKAFEPRFAAKVLNSIVKSGPEGEIRAASLQKLLSVGGAKPGSLPDFSGPEGES